MVTTPPFRCPVCSEPLVCDQRALRCINHHCFDLAREGYVNLLLAQHKSSRHPGDSHAMMQSRQRFLNAGYYSVLVERLTDIIQHNAIAHSATIVDVGCGEGYYVDGIAKRLADRCRYVLAGIDIAKQGVRLAAKRHVFDQLAVASAYNLPYAPNMIDYIVSVFSPISSAECYRVLKPGGTLIVVGPGEIHLRGLVERIYDEVVPHEANFSAVDCLQHFRLIEPQALEAEIIVNGDHIDALLKMTPYYWHATADQQADLNGLSQLITPVSFAVNVYQKLSSAHSGSPSSLFVCKQGSAG